MPWMGLTLYNFLLVTLLSFVLRVFIMNQCCLLWSLVSLYDDVSLKKLSVNSSCKFVQFLLLLCCYQVHSVLFIFNWLISLVPILVQSFNQYCLLFLLCYALDLYNSDWMVPSEKISGIFPCSILSVMFLRSSSLIAPLFFFIVFV